MSDATPKPDPRFTYQRTVPQGTTVQRLDSLMNWITSAKPTPGNEIEFYVEAGLTVLEIATSLVYIVARNQIEAANELGTKQQNEQNQASHDQGEVNNAETIPGK